jgi:pimeloyl-ACP methyl ester carboxylesterase
VAQLQLTRFVILGNSIAGAVAIRHAAAHPEHRLIKPPQPLSSGATRGAAFA